MSIRITSKIRSKLLASPSRIFFGSRDSWTRADKKVIAKMRANDSFPRDYEDRYIAGFLKGFNAPRLLLNARMNDIESILNSYTLDHQIEQTMSEMMELEVELVEYQRSAEDDPSDYDRLKPLCSEIADVLIMATQMALAFGMEEVNQQIVYKITRQQQRIEERDEH